MQSHFLINDHLVDLMLLSREGDEDAFHRLVMKVDPLLKIRLYRRCGDRWLAEDLTQVVLMRIYGARKRYKPTAPFVAWMNRIADNVHKNHLRYLSKRRCFDSAVRDVDKPVAIPDELEHEDRLAVFRTTLSSLRSSWRQACLLQLEGRTYAEIAAEMGLTIQAVKSSLNRARAFLRSRLAELAPDDFAA